MAILSEIDRWGPSLGQYLDSRRTPSSQRQIGCLPSLEQLQASISALTDPSSVTYSTLEDVLSVTQYPHELHALGNIPLTHVSVELLQGYTKSNSLFDRQYGLLCLQVLVLSLQINVLKVNDALEEFIEETSGMASYMDVSSMLAERAAKMELPSVESWNIEHLHKHQDNSFFLAKQQWRGDLSSEDIAKIQAWLWQDHRSFFDVCGVASDTHWTLLFLLFWYKNMQLMKSDASRKECRLLYQLDNLICRYVLATPQAKELRLISHISRWIQEELHQRGFTDEEEMRPPTKDLQDATMFREATVHRLVPPQGPPLALNMTLSLFRFVAQHDLYSLKTINLEVLPYVEAIYTRLWVDLEHERCLVESGWRVKVLRLMRIVFECASASVGGTILAKHKLDTPMSDDVLKIANPITKSLYTIDWVNLIGRILLLPIMPYGNKHPSREAFDRNQERWPETQKRIILQCRILFAYDQRSLEEFNSNYGDWMKIWNFIKSQRAMLFAQKHLRDHLTQCETIWMEVGNALGFITRSNLRCAYTGCTGPEPLHQTPLSVCGRCRAKNYCSVSCQTIDWRIDTPGSHYLECTAGMMRPLVPVINGPTVHLH